MEALIFKIILLTASIIFLAWFVISLIRDRNKGRKAKYIDIALVVTLTFNIIRLGFNIFT